jgi:hypothetical protein
MRGNLAVHGQAYVGDNLDVQGDLTVYGNIYTPNSNKLVASYVFGSDATNTGAITVDLNNHGGVYEIYVIGTSSSDSGYRIEYNGVTTNYKHIRWYNNASTVTGSGATTALAGYMYTRASTNVHTITMPNGYPQSTQINTIMNTSNLLEALFYNQGLTTQQTNITSITLTMNSGNFKAGTQVLIYKK